MSLSRRSLVLVSLIILLAIGGIWQGQPLLGLWRLPAMFLLLMMAWERFQLNRQFTITRHIAPRISLGEKTRYQQAVSNHGGQKLYLDSQPCCPESILAEQQLDRWTIAAGQTQEKEYTLTPMTLGQASLGKLYARVLGKFGLIWWNHNHTEQSMFTVEPASLIHAQRLSGLGRTGGRKTPYKPGSGFELLALRDYQYGDSQRNIDWKASAKRQKPMVRVFSQEQRLEIAILIDCGRASYIQCKLMDRLHHYVNIAATLTDFAVSHDDQVACIAYADKIIANVPMMGGVSAVKQTRSLLSNLKVMPEESNPLSVALELKRFLKRRSLVIFLTEIEQAEAATQLIQAVHLLRLKHSIVIASINDPSIADLTHQSAQHWLAPYQNFAALEYIRGRELTQSKLRHSGVSVISSPAESLNDKVLNYYQQLRERREV